MKRLKWILIGVFGLIVAVAAIVIIRLDGIVRYEIQSQSAASLGVDTRLDAAHVSLLGGSLQLTDFQVSSPKGFAADRMFMLGGAKVGVSVSKLRDDPVTINQIVIDKPKLVIEQAGGKINFRALAETLPQRPADSGGSSEPIKLIIHDLAINDAEVVIRPGIPGMEQEVAIPIPSVQLKDIGTGEGNQNGVAIREVVMLVVTTLAQKASESERLPKEARAILSMNADQIKAQVQGKVQKKLDKVGKDVGKQIDKGIGDLLGDKDTKDRKKSK